MPIQKVLPYNNERRCMVTKGHLLTSWPALPRVSSNSPRKNGKSAARPRCSCKEACDAGSGVPWPARARQLRHYVRRQAVSTDAAEPHPHAHATEATSVQTWLHAFWKFTRPHTMAGTAISVLSISLLAMQSPQAVKLQAVDMSVAAGAALQALSAALLANIAVVGLNQLTDIEIDKVGEVEVEQCLDRASITPAATGSMGMCVVMCMAQPECVLDDAPKQLHQKGNTPHPTPPTITMGPDRCCTPAAAACQRHPRCVAGLHPSNTASPHVG